MTVLGPRSQGLRKASRTGVEMEGAVMVDGKGAWNKAQFGRCVDVLVYGFCDGVREWKGEGVLSA